MKSANTRKAANRNKVAQAVRTPLYRMRVVRPRRGKGSYRRSTRGGSE